MGLFDWMGLMPIEEHKEAVEELEDKLRDAEAKYTKAESELKSQKEAYRLLAERNEELKRKLKGRRDARGRFAKGERSDRK